MEWLDILRRIETGEDTRTEFNSVSATFPLLVNRYALLPMAKAGLSYSVPTVPAPLSASRVTRKVQERLRDFLHAGCGRPIAAEYNRHRADDGRVRWINVRCHQQGYDPFRFDGRF